MDSLPVLAVDPISIAIGIGIGLLLSFLLVPKPKPVIIPVNPSIEKENPKVGLRCTVKDIEDLIEASPKGKVSYCRCWRSEKFPYCDGAHRDYNAECKDNTGPLTIVKQE
ncbi:CDGSH iron-sulfur domain-containing protein [Seminavis robusta]|uniref:CDGSH iron-sulfur domain-containing protein n=1 Tax=Seminavis robusta TaxID=568900 RepID=A0A9N8DGD7_9STRA|nr:CDGSH iron-sulfur domain-containing protein [Seminavis robusta]|eukprot:Sro112_g055720.1 CDGSH iron-sulfur domain-containing protein (110) ;mRNA; f:70794-71123